MRTAEEWVELEVSFELVKGPMGPDARIEFYKNIQSDIVETAANVLASKAVFAKTPELNKAYIECEREVRGMIPEAK